MRQRFKPRPRGGTYKECTDVHDGLKEVGKDPFADIMGFRFKSEIPSGDTTVAVFEECSEAVVSCIRNMFKD